MKINSIFGSRAARSDQEQGSKTLLAFDVDPYTVSLAQADITELVVIQAGSIEEATAAMDHEPDVLLVNLAAKDSELVLALQPNAYSIGIGRSSAQNGEAQPKVNASLNLPFTPQDLNDSVRKAFGMPSSGDKSHGAVDRADVWLGRTWVFSAVLALLLELANGAGASKLALGIAVVAYGCIRMISGTRGQIGTGLDVLVATLLLAGTGGLGSSYVLIGLVAAIEAGLVFPLRIALAAGALVTTGSFSQVVDAVESGNAEVRELIAWLLIFPLAALASSFWSRIARGDSEGGRLLAEANDLLSTLTRIARSMPGQLEVGGAAAHALTISREAFGAEQGVLLLAEGGIFTPAASYGLSLTEVLIAGDDTRLANLLENGARTARGEELPYQFDGALDDSACWLVAPLRHGGAGFGLLMVACPDESRHEANTLILQQLANDAAVAIENARLFREVRELSIDEERKRLARELHDAIGQSLTHIRLELEFLARHGVTSVEAAGEEAARLARVVDRAASEVRMMINGLSSMVSREGLAASLDTYLNDLRGLVVRDITFESQGSGNLPADIEGEVFRIAQEAVSNALRHSKADKIHVVLEAQDWEFSLTVDDDGIGFDSPNRKRKGLGLESMRERAKAIGGSLAVEAKPDGGTKVMLTIKTAPVSGAQPTQEAVSA
jgi:signal transduction histidine kinase